MSFSDAWYGLKGTTFPTKPIDISQLIPTQEGIRSYENIAQMIEFVKGGGEFAQEAIDNYPKRPGDIPQPLIQLYALDRSGKLYVTDGHHRIVSILLSQKRTTISESEAIIHFTNFNYFNTIEVDNNWFTPFDPRYEVRLPDTSKFRAIIKGLEKNDAPNYEYIKFIVRNEGMFKKYRTLHSFIELCDHVEKGKIK